MRIPITRPYLGADEREALYSVLESGWIAQGAKTAEFEREFAARHDSSHAVATTSCTTALHLALASLRLTEGDEVIVPSFTFIATANAVEYVRARPVFVDVVPETYNIDPSLVSAAVSSRTRAIIPVHLFGLSADMAPLQKIASHHGLDVVEDAACAVGSRYRGRAAGSFGTFGAFSLHARKLITCGEGGVLTTNDAALAARARALRSHGAPVSAADRDAAEDFLLSPFPEIGFNYRLPDLQAAVALAQLRKLDGILQQRRALAARYDAALSGLRSFLRLPSEPEGCFHSYQSYVVAVLPTSPIDRDALARGLIGAGISVRQGTHAVHLQDAYRVRYGLQPDAYPHSRDAARVSLALPIYPGMTDGELDYVVEQIHGLLQGRAASQSAV